MLFVYDDYVHNNGPLYRFLRTYLPDLSARPVTATDLLSGVLTDHRPRAFIMPGGASRYVTDKLRGAGNAAISTYVEDGGVYVGICAGAYYACAEIQWNQKGETPLSATGELNFVNGTASGPIEEFCTRDGGELRTARIVRLQCGDQVDAAQALYWGGPYLPDAPGLDVLARYTDLPSHAPAIVRGTYGKGRFLLSSPHCEIGPSDVALRQFDVPMNRYDYMTGLDGAQINAPPLFASLLKRAL